MHVFPRRIPNGKQGGGRAGDVRFWSKSLPPPPATPPREETSCRLRCKPRGLPRWFSGSVCGEAGAAPGAHLPFRNIIPRQFRVPEGEGAAGRGGDENRGRRFQPGSSSPTQRLPRTARGGGWTEGCAVYPEGCMSRGNGPPRSQIFKKFTSLTVSPAAASGAKPWSTSAGDREAPGSRDLTSARAREVEVAATRARGAGRHPAVRSAAAGQGLRLGAAPPPGRRRPPARRAPRVRALGCRRLSARQSAQPAISFPRSPCERFSLPLMQEMRKRRQSV